MLKGFKTFIFTALSSLASALYLFGFTATGDSVEDFSGTATAQVENWEEIAAELLAEINHSSPELQAQAAELLAEVRETAAQGSQVITRTKEQTWPMIVAFLTALGGFATRLHTRFYAGV